MKKSFVITFVLILMGTVSVAAAPEAPQFSLNGGVYEERIEVELTGEGDIYYTTDGSVPTETSQKYSSPIVIEKSNTQVPKGTVIRAAVIENGETSYVSSNSYFVGDNIWDYVGNFPFVNLVAEPYDLWDSQNGIYQNYAYEHKVSGVFHYITTDGQSEVNRLIEMKVSGNGSRSNPKKSLRIYFKKKDPTQTKYLEYDLIPSAEVDYYSKVTFRISDWSSTNVRDVLAQKIAEKTRVDTAQSVPTVLFLNGEYWGLYECREQYDKDYIASHYSIDSDDVVMFDRDWTLNADYTEYNGKTYVDKLDYAEGPEDGNKKGLLGETYYREQWAYVKSLVLDNDFASDEVYEEFASVVDVDNLIDYLFVYIYSANDDWPGNNMKFWRVTEESIDENVYGADGKWRFMVHDFDIAYESASHNTLYLSTKQKDDASQARHPAFATDLIEGLFKNEDFRNEFAQRSMVYLRSICSGTDMYDMVTELMNEREAGKSADLARWSLGNINSWKNNLNKIISFGGSRPANLRNQYMNLFNTYYNAGIDGVVIFNTEGDECSISGGKISGKHELKMFSGIPVTIEAEGAYITIESNTETVTAFGKIEFTPSENCNIKVQKADVAIWNCKVENSYLSAVLYADEETGENARAFAAGYNKDGDVVFVKEMEFGKTSLPVPECDEYKIFIWNGVEPLCENCIVK